MVIPAAGQGKRFGSSENKIWAHISGKSVLDRTLTAFNNHHLISSIVIVAGAEELDRVKVATAIYSKVSAVVAGGNTRTESVLNGLNSLPTDTEIVLVHDAARPLVPAAVIDRVIACTILRGSAVPGIPLSDTVKRVNGAGIVRETVMRSATINDEHLPGLTAVQTPQGAKVEILRSAYAAAAKAPANPHITDEASLIEANGGTVAIAAGDPINMKVTRSEDIQLAERLLGHGEVRTGFGYDVHAFAEPSANRKLFLGGVEFEHDRGLEGHSDADVVLHAICDALLGASSLGDIGVLFPNTDNSFKNISSLKLLSEVQRRLLSDGWRIVNIDATAVAETPKIMPQRHLIIQTIANELQIEPNRVSIKATTAEKLGFVGRKEGIECSAIATLERTP